MARRGGNPRVSITADADGVDRATRQAAGSLDRLDKDGSKSLDRLKQAAAGMALAVGAGTAVALKKSVDAAIEAEKTQARLEAQLKASNISYQAHAKQIDEVIQKHSKLSGLDDEDLTDAFTNIVRVTGDVDKSLRLTGLAADFARAKHMDVAKAGELVGKVAGGNTGILSRYGIQVEKGASATEALGVLQQKFAGQAEAYGKTTAGANDRVSVAAENLGEVVGTRLTPLLAKGANALLDLFDKAGKLAGPIRTATGSIAGFARRISDAFSGGDKDATRWAANVRRFVTMAIGFFKDLGRSIGRIFEGSGEDFRIIGRALLRLARVFSDVVVEITRRVLPILKSAIEGIAGVVRGVVKIVAGILSGDFSKAWDGAKTVVRSALRGLAAVIKGTSDLLGEAMTALARFLIRQIGKGLSGLAGVVKDNVVDGIETGLGAAAKIIPGLDIGLKLAGKIGDGVGRSAAKGYVGGTGAGLDGADADLGPFARLGASMGVRVSSGLRLGAITSTGNPSYHGTGDAIDQVGTLGAMRRYASALFHRFGGRLRELISPFPEFGIKDGRPFRYSPSIQAQHSGSNAHVHVAYTGPFGDGIGQAAGAARAAGWRGDDLLTAIAIAGPESGYDNQARLVTSREDSRGMWQINTLAHPWAARLDLTNPDVAARAAYRVWREAGGFGPWSAYTSGDYQDFLDDARAAIAGPASSGGRGRARARPMSPAARARQAFGNAQGRAATDLRNALRRAAGKAPARGPAKGVDRGSGLAPGEPFPTYAEDKPTELDFLNRHLAVAGVDGNTAGQLDALRGIEGFWTRKLLEAQGTADPRDDIEAAGGLSSVREAIKSLDESIQQANRLQEQDRALREEDVELRRRLVALTETQGPQLLAAVIAAVNGGIGGGLGLAMQSAGVPGTVGRA